MTLLGRDHNFPAVAFAAPLCLLVLATQLFAADTPGVTSSRIAVLAEGGAHGELHACRCPGVTSSGPALRASVFRRARSFTHPAVLLESGDFTTGAEDSLREERFHLFVDVMALMDYDAVGLGEAEIDLGPEVIRNAASKLPLVCANLAEPEVWGVPPVRRTDRAGFHVLITAFVDPDLPVPMLRAGSKGRWLGDPLESLARILPPVPDSTLVIVIAHGSDARLRDVLERFPSIDIAVRGQDTEDGPSLSTVGRVPVLLPGPHAMNVVQLTGDFGPDGTLIQRTARTWELKQETRGHARIDALVREFETRHGLE